MWSRAKNGLVQPLKQGRTSPLCLLRKREISRDLARKQKKIGGSIEPPILVGLFIPDLLKGKEPRLTKHIPEVPKMLVFTKNFETRKEYDYGKVHYTKRHQIRTSRRTILPDA